MHAKNRRSLKNLLFIHEIAFLLLVAVTGLLGGLSAFFWQETSSESVRINDMIYVTERIRGELFRQIQQVIRARMLEDTQAFEVYRANSRQISELFNELRRKSGSREEAELIQSLQQSYRIIQHDMNAIFSDPYATNSETRMKLLDPRFAQRMTAVFDARYSTLKDSLNAAHGELDVVIERWTRFAPVFIPIIFVVSLVLVLYTRRILIHGFVKPMATVMKGAALIRQGDLQHRISESGVEEVTEIASSLNSMASELSASRDALVESERQAALGALIPVVAHNIRNPLASIRATAQILDDVEDREELQESKSAIMDTIDRLGRWVSALVSYLHPLKPQIKSTTARQLINSAMNMVSSKRDEKNIKVVFTGEVEDLTLKVDPDLMEQAFYCLLSNALEASPDGGVIEVMLKDDANTTSITISDQGPGLPFEPTPGNLEPGPSTKKFGTGLGIPVAFKICQSHGWELSFLNDNPGTKVVLTCEEKQEGK